MSYSSRDIRETSGVKAQKLVSKLEGQGITFKDGSGLDVGIFGAGKPVNKHRTLLCLAKDWIEESPWEAVRYRKYYFDGSANVLIGLRFELSQ